MFQNDDGRRPSKIAVKLAKKTSEVRNHGPSYVIRKFLRDHFYKHERVYLLRRDLTVPLPAITRRKRDTKEIRFLAGKDDMEGFAPFLSDHSRHMKKLFDDGIRCAATFVDGAVIAYLWMIPDGLYDKELHYQVCCAPDEILQGVYVHPDYRGSPILLQLLEFGWDFYRRQGYSSVLGIVLENNKPSMRMHLRLGFEETGQRLHTRKLTALRWTRDESYQGQCLLENTVDKNKM